MQQLFKQLVTKIAMSIFIMQVNLHKIKYTIAYHNHKLINH
jgi:hypothetical protein